MKGSCFKPSCYVLVVLLLLHVNSSLEFKSGVDTIRCIERERQALLAFKQGVVDTDNRLSSWGTQAQNKDCCKWEGVYCSNQTGHVIELDLRDQSLQGMISPKLTELQHLRLLDLSFNDFSRGEISNFNIGSLTNLRLLDLSYAGLGGQFPYHQLGNITHLQYLNLGWNYFTNDHVENLSWLHHLSSLQVLDLSSVNLSNVFDWLKVVNQLSQLRELSLRDCSLFDPPILSTPSGSNYSKLLASVDLGINHITSSIYPWLFNMSSLEYLDLGYNQLVGGIPRSFAKLCNLKSLNIMVNNLSGQFSEVAEILSTCAQNSLESLDLSSNHLAGSIPNLTNFLSLEELYLFDNQLRGKIPESIGQMSKLNLLYLGYNSLEGVISETHFSNLSKLVELDLSHNSVVLNFQSDWVPPFQLIWIFFESCKVGPNFPKWLRTQKKIQRLDISNAGISDVLPNWFWFSFSRASFINLSHNQLKGTLENLTLEFLYHPVLNLSSNQLEGSIPTFLSKTLILDLSNNNLSGSVSFLCSTTAKNLTFLDLSRNTLSEELPNCWTHVINLVVLDLSYNVFSGNIPTTIGSLYRLETLKLRSNQLVGELPLSLENCTQLRVIDIGYNKLSGLLPKWLGSLSGTQNLIILMLQSNHFNGSMPLHLCNLAGIQILDLSMNNISGTIPKCLNKLTTLAQQGNSSPTIKHYFVSFDGEINTFQYDYDDDASFIWKGRMNTYKSILGLVKKIDLASNKLTGEIPSEITHLVGLISLNLSRNHLSGQISPEIGKLQSLEVLDLSRNHIYGRIPTSLAQIYGLGVLDLSNNNLSDKIPTGPQLQTLDPSGFEGNPQLCGKPLQKVCPSEETGSKEKVFMDEESKDELVTQEFYVSMGLGFFAGFCGVFGTLLINRTWRYAYFNFLNDVSDWIYMRISLIRQPRMFSR